MSEHGCTEIGNAFGGYDCFCGDPLLYINEQWGCETIGWGNPEPTEQQIAWRKLVLALAHSLRLDRFARWLNSKLARRGGDA